MTFTGHDLDSFFNNKFDGVYTKDGNFIIHFKKDYYYIKNNGFRFIVYLSKNNNDLECLNIVNDLQSAIKFILNLV